MSEQSNQFVALYKTGAKDIDIIAQALETSRETVHAILFEHCPEYRADLTRASGASSKPLADEMLDILAGLARNSTSDIVKLSSARYVRDDQLGRRDADATAATAGAALMDALAQRMAGLQANRERFLQNRPTIQLLDEHASNA